MTFQFGFDNDNERPSTAGNKQDAAQVTETNVNAVNLLPVRQHKLDDLLQTLPERISYSVVRIESPIGRVLYLPRRDLHDVKVQLLCEGDDNDEVIDQLDKSDLRSGIYEGGFKTWECSLDLASLLLDRGPRKDIDELIRCDQVIELGAGTAMPSLVLFQHALRNDIPITFTLADFNDTVLRLVTLPNILLTWAAATGVLQLPHSDVNGKSEGDIEISEMLVDKFRSTLRDRMIHLNFLSGPWSPQLTSLIPSSAPDMGTLILAAETVYSPSSTTAFVNTLVELLQRVRMSKAMVAAKRIYFGVGGSVDGLKIACREMNAVAYEIENHGVPGLDSGVGRALVEVQMY